MFKKVSGTDATVAQVSVFFTLISLISSFLLWPLVLVFTLTGVETVSWDNLPWIQLVGSGALSLGN